VKGKYSSFSSYEEKELGPDAKGITGLKSRLLSD
jgi:hypothetical protein